MLENLWNYNLQVIPVAISLLLFEIPALVRRLKRLYYVPVYFLIFPLRELNPDLSIYLGEDYFTGGTTLSDKEAEKLRWNIVLKSVISMFIAAVGTPLVVGFVISFFLTGETFSQFLIVLLVYKLIGITRSILQFHRHAIGTTRNRILLGVIYVCYLGVIIEMLKAAYYWARPYVLAAQWSNLVSDLSSLLFGRVVVGLLIVSIVTGVLVSLIVERRLRE